MLKELLESIFTRTTVDPNKAKLEHDTLNQPLMVLPVEQKVHDLSQYLKEPLRTSESRPFLTAGSFIQYVNTFKLSNTYLFTYPRFDDFKNRFTFIRAVIDYHQSDKPHWCNHEALFLLSASRQLDEWLSKEGETMSQRAFIDHIKDNAADIANPALGELLDALKKITVNGRAALNSSVDGHSGSTNASASVDIKGVPELIELAIPLFYMGDKYKIKVRIYVTGGEGGVDISYKLSNLKESLDMEYQAIVKKVSEQTGIELAY